MCADLLSHFVHVIYHRSIFDMWNYFLQARTFRQKVRAHCELLAQQSMQMHMHFTFTNQDGEYSMKPIFQRFKLVCRRFDVLLGILLLQQRPSRAASCEGRPYANKSPGWRGTNEKRSVLGSAWMEIAINCGLEGKASCLLKDNGHR